MGNYQGEKSYVGMTNCYFCGGGAEILIDRRMRNTLSRNMGVRSMEPCNECKGYMKQGVILMSISDDTTEEQMKGPMPNPYRTGGWVVIRDEAISKIFDEKFAAFALKYRFCFITDEAWDRMGIPRGKVEGVPSE